MLLIRESVDLRVSGCKTPAVSLHEKRGSDSEAGVMRDKLSNAQIGHNWPCWVRNTSWVSLGLAVFAEGSLRHAHGRWSRSSLTMQSLRLRRRIPSNAALEGTVTSPTRIIPPKLHVAAAHMAASKQSRGLRAECREKSISRVTGGVGGGRLFAWIRSSPRNYQSMRVSSRSSV